MKIAYIAEGNIPSSAANSVQVLQMASAMAQLGHAVQVMSPLHEARVRDDFGLQRLHADYALASRIDLRYLPYVEVFNRLRGSYHYAGALWARALGNQVAFTRNPRIAALAVRLGLRAIVELHSPPTSVRAQRAIEWLGGRRDQVRWVFISERLKQLSFERAAFDERACLVEHDGVDLRRFETRLTRAEARQKLQLDPHRQLVVHAGHLYEGRGAELLLACAAALPEVDFLFVGGRPDDVARVKADAARAGLANVQLTGHRPVSEVPCYLFAADVLAMPYTSNTRVSDGKLKTIEWASPMKLFEYMASGRPIVGTSFPAISEVLRAGVNSVLVKPDDAAVFEEGLRSLLNDAPRGEALAKQALSDVNGYTWDKRAGRILDSLAA
jgi:glycosyltransferase involved in cell wall biosynthesis